MLYSPLLYGVPVQYICQNHKMKPDPLPQVHWSQCEKDSDCFVVKSVCEQCIVATNRIGKEEIEIKKSFVSPLLLGSCITYKKLNRVSPFCLHNFCQLKI